MLRSRVARILLVLLFGALGGCREFYDYNNQRYEDASDALAAQSDNERNILAGITPAQKPINGTLRVYIPTSERIRQTGVVQTGSASVSDEIWSYVITVTERDLEGMGRALKKRNAFTSIAISKRFDLGDPKDDEADFVVWMELPQPGTGAWYFRRRGQAGRDLIPLDTGVPAGLPRVTAWLDSIEGFAQGETGSRPASPRSPSQAPASGDPADKLLRLQKLYDDGMITDQEFRKARSRVLDDL